jgi:endonuclease/exonuclease/phosphatase family metal-dependent hydrolase
MMNTEEVELNNDDSFIDAPINAISHPLYPLYGVNNTASRKHINITAYNIFLRPPLVKNNESDHKDARLREFIKQLSEFDIVCLQEMFGFLNKRKHKLIRCAAKAGFLYYADSTSPSFFTSFVVDGGLLVLSRFPILASEFKPYPYGIFSDALSQKGVLYTKIQVKDEILHLFSTHTQASYFGENQKYPIIARADQFTMLRQFIKTILPKNNYKEGEMVLIVGDFNVDSRHPHIDSDKIKDYSGFKEYPHLNEDGRLNEYDAMTCYLSDNYTDDIEDLLLKSYGEHPVTYADSFTDDAGELKPLETVLTHKDDLCSNQSLDYIFRLHPKSIVNTKRRDIEEGGLLPKQGKLRIIEGSAKVAKFFVDSCDFSQLSDHYGTMVTLEYKSLGPKASWEDRIDNQIYAKNLLYQEQQMNQEKVLML